MAIHRLWIGIVGTLLLIFFSFSNLLAQGSYTAQIRGTVTDPSGAVVAHAKVTLTDDGNGFSISAQTDGSGLYVINGLRPSKYGAKVEALGFRDVMQKDIVLAVSQQATLDFSLKPLSVIETMTVVDTAPLLDTGGGSLGTEVTNEFINRIPLANRDVTKLVYLSAGVTELNNGVGYPVGTDFSSNGQRYASAEIRLDGTLATGPEQGEGATSNLSYVPSSEVIQEFKVQNNSFSAEYGSNGGTVVNILLKSGTNKFHGSGWWYGRRTDLNANDFFSNRDGIPRAASTRDQYGFSVTGPIIKNKTFFLFDLERVRQNDKALISARVPTDLERTGDFSQTLVADDNGNLVPVQLFNPFDLNPDNTRNPFPVTPDGRQNVIPDALIDKAVGQKLANAYPEPTGPVDPATQTNFQQGVVNTSPSTQFDIKIDHQLNEKNHLMGRYSQNNSSFTNPDPFFGGLVGDQITRNIVLEHTWSISSRLLLTSRFGVDRYHQVGTSQHVDPTQFGLPDLLTRANGIVRMPVIVADNYTGLNSDQFGGEQCCADTINGHTQYVYSSAMNWVKGAHVFKFGFEQRQFFNNFYQPDYATGRISFGKIITAEDPFGGSPSEDGTGLAGMLLGFPDSGQLNIKTAVANKSLETAFYAQDDWKVTPRLTINLGLRYEWSTPYSERHNRIQFSDFNAVSGVNVDLTPPTTDWEGNPLPADLSGFGLGPTNLKGITRFVDSSHRHVPVDRNNFGPRIGFAYEIRNNTVLRGGAGMFYGISSATNFQYAGTAFRRDAPIHFLATDSVHQDATLTNLFPNLPSGQLPTPQGTTYGPLAEWGYVNQNDLGTTEARNPEIYQWNLGVQHLFPFGVVLSADYSANRSTHLPWGGATRNRNILPANIRDALVQQLNPTHDPNDSSVSSLLNTSVPNPFRSLFAGPGAIFNEPDSRYTDNGQGVPLLNLLRPYPQFDNNFEGLPLLAASSWYHALLVRFQKRASHGLSFEGSYTWAKATDNSSYGANSFIFFNGSGLGFPQDLNNLGAEHSVGANDNRHRFVLGAVYDLPLGRHRWLGGDWPAVLDAIAGGWSANALLTFQTGQPIPFGMSTPRLADGNQRPDITCNPMSGLSLHDVATSTDPSANYFNANCIQDPGDQIAGNAPRFSDNARGPGIKNLDLGIFKDFPIREGMKAEVRAEFLNATNTVRFATPSSFQGDTGFGLVTTQANTPRRIQLAVRFEF
ncbi:MAG: TonB-dependent receptor [Acidobacteriia bacterium]|nr:TonB-dependent receptor [Terriglobia bacterium]